VAIYSIVWQGSVQKMMNNKITPIRRKISEQQMTVKNRMKDMRYEQV